MLGGGLGPTTCATRVYASRAPVAPSTAKAVGSDSSSAGCLIRVRVGVRVGVRVRVRVRALPACMSSVTPW